MFHACSESCRSGVRIRSLKVNVNSLDLENDVKDQSDKVCSTVLEKVDEEKRMLNTTWQRKHRWWAEAREVS